jgi:hypothetical protein
MRLQRPGRRLAALALGCFACLARPAVSAAGDVAIEAETLLGTAQASDGRVVRQDMAGFGSGWSGGAQLFWTPSREGAQLVLSPTLPAADRYRLRFAYTRAPDYARVRVSLDGRSLGEIDGFARRVQTGSADVGDPFEVSAGAHELVFTIAGRNPAASGFFAGLDRIDFVEAPATSAPPEAPPPPVNPAPTGPSLPPWTSKDVIDKRIDVAAQYALMRMFKGDPTERVDASNILSAVKSGALGGIYQEDQQVPALRAQSLGTWWGTILPKPVGGVRVDGVCMLEPPEKPPIIVMRRKAEKNPAAYDRSLQAAWAMCGLPGSPVRPYLTSPGTPLPPGKASRCESPQEEASFVSVRILRGTENVENAGVSLSSQGYIEDRFTGADGMARFEPVQPGYYALHVSGAEVEPEESFTVAVEVLPKCATLLTYDLAAVREGRDDCTRARARARSECVTPELVEAKQRCYEAYAGRLHSCPEGNQECEGQASQLAAECIAPIDGEFESCRRRIEAEAGCPSN